jgi:hypothetical protein
MLFQRRQSGTAAGRIVANEAVRLQIAAAVFAARIEGSSMFAHRLPREIALLLLLKAAALTLLFLLFFSPSQRPHIDAGRMEQHILSEPLRP